MPENVRDNYTLAALFVLGLCLSPAFCTSANGDEGNKAPAAPAAGDGTSNTDPAAGKASEKIGGDIPDDPREAYRLKQRKSVQALRRMDKSLLTTKVIADFQKHYKAYRSFVTQGINTRNPKELEALKAALAYKLYSLSDVSIQQAPLDLENALKSIRRDISRAGSSLGTNQQKQQFRELFFTEMIPLLKQLLTNNMVARSLAIEILQDLQVDRAGPQGRLEMFDLVDNILIDVLNDPEQPDFVKTRAANTVTNYLQKTESIPQVQMAFAEAIAKQLEKPHTEVAYQEYLLVTLEALTTPRKITPPNTAIAFCTSAAIMQDRNRDIQIRCHAARVLGRAGFDTKTNFEVLAWATAQLGVEAAALFNRDKNKANPKWTFCGFYLYTAFHHWEKEEVAMRKGFLNRMPRSEEVRNAWTALLPVATHMMVNKTIVPKNDWINLFKWAEANQPANRRYDPTCPPLPTLAAAGGAAAVSAKGADNN